MPCASVAHRWLRPSAVMTRSLAPDVHDWAACAPGTGAGPAVTTNPLTEGLPQVSLDRSGVPEGAQGRVDPARPRTRRGRRRDRRGGRGAVAGGQRFGVQEPGQLAQPVPVVAAA